MLDRHNAVCREIYYQMCKRFGLDTVHFTQVIPPVSENDRVKVLYDTYVVTRHKISHNRPDMVVFDKTQKRITVIEVGVTWYSMLSQIDAYKYTKYAVNSMEKGMTPGSVTVADRNLAGELGEMHGRVYPAGVRVIPIVIGCCGEVETHVSTRLAELGFEGKAGKVLLERLQRGVVLGTSRLIRAHLAV